MLTIGELARLAGTTVRAVRHYHAEGLLDEPPRDRSGYRRYGAQDLVRLIRIRRLRELGLSLEQVRELLDRPGTLAEALDALDTELAARQRQIEEQRARIARLRRSTVDPELPPGFAELFGELAAHGVNPDYLAREKEGLLLALALVPESGQQLLDQQRRVLNGPNARRYVELGERLEELAEADPDDPRVAQLAAELVDLLHTDFAELLTSPPAHAPARPVEAALFADWVNTLGPAQRRVVQHVTDTLQRLLPTDDDQPRTPTG